VVGNPFLFSGRRYDAESGLYLYRTRYLDPRAGRFITRDPLGAWWDPTSLGNAFTYAGNNPRSRLDPYGLAAAPVVAPVVEVTAEMIITELTVIEGGAAVAGGTAAGAAAAGGALVGGIALGAPAVQRAEDIEFEQKRRAWEEIVDAFRWWGEQIDGLFGDDTAPDPQGENGLDVRAEDYDSTIPTDEGDPVPDGEGEGGRRREECRRVGGMQECTVFCVYAPKVGCSEDQVCPAAREFTGLSMQCRSACAEAQRAARQNAGPNCDVFCGQVR
jgi:RHS repeat-associated protein